MGHSQYLTPSILLSVLMMTFFIPFNADKSYQNEGRVIKVIDGDTIKVKTRFGSFQKIRLAYIDAPELKQMDISKRVKVGELSRDHLKRLIEGKYVRWIVSTKDIYRRLIAEVYYQEMDICLDMIKKGMAIIYPYSKFSSPSQKDSYFQHFYHAYGTRKGIWSTKGIMNPYYFRREKREKSRRRP